MIAFLFAYLGSTIFWAVYAVTTLFVGTYLFRRFDSDILNYMKTGVAEYKDGDEKMYMVGPGDVAWGLIVFYIFWPLVLIGIGICYIFKFIGFVFKHIVWGLLKNAILFADKSMPNKDEKVIKPDGDDDDK